MIGFLQFAVQFCFWLFLALVLGSLCAVGIWTLLVVIRGMKGRK